MIIGLLVSACSFPGSSSNATTTIPTTVITPTAIQTHPRTVANQPPTTGRLPPGQPLPENAIKSLTFNLADTDITRGNNLFYPATRGWDYATGWGSPNFNDILQLEAGQ